MKYATCHAERQHKSKGLCQNCYARQYYYTEKCRERNFIYRKSGNRKAALYKYNHSEKGKDARARYYKTENARIVRVESSRKRYKENGPSKSTIKYQKSEKWKQTLMRYRQTQDRKDAMKRYNQTEKGKANARRINHRRRARKLNIFTFRYPGDFAAIVARFRYACAYCHRTDVKLTEDHVIPISWGGHDAPWNIVPACDRCNKSKGARVWLVLRAA